MNKNTIIGVLLIVGILVMFFFINKPSKEEQQRMDRQRDSIAKVEKEQLAKHKSDSIAFASQKTTKNDTVIKHKANDSIHADSSVSAELKDEFGIFSGSHNGTRKFVTVENELAKFRFSNQGGRLFYVQLKKYRTFDSLPLILMNGDSTVFNMLFYAKNRQINTSKLYFTAVIADSRFANKDSIVIKPTDSLKIAMRLYADSSLSSDKSKYIELLYTIYGNDYMMKMQMSFVGLQEIAAENPNGIGLDWKMNLRQQEKSMKAEKNASTIYFKYFDDEVDYIAESKSEQKDLATKVSWIGFKQQFFTSVLIADKGFTSAKITTQKEDTVKRYIKICSADIIVPIDPNSKQGFPMRFYFGPNHYKTLRKYGLDLERQIPLGWSSPYVFGWINRFAVIPVFNWLESTGMNYGIIILILTILLKIVLFPIAYKTYMSSAKMRVLKPEIEEINKKIPKEKAMERQQATMALYKKAGVNPLAGCVPMLLQLPIVYAFFRFFPASIELRQQHFLWATDLSSYDSIYNFGFNVPLYGDHISLFTILMTISTIIYTKVNNQLMGSQQQMPGMKFMMYAMPIMFLGIFNDFASGLSYYYFLANMFTFLQMWVIRKSVNEEKIHAKIQENKKRPDTKKKSGFQKRLEDMAKQRGYNPPKKK
jgi:YidC/Oxa1 family membrane protein insertase